MKTVFSIFHNDIKSIVRNFFILVIVLALGTLPALYAWINIYACWDPYVNTGDVEVAVASRDTGIDLKNGTHVNKANEIIDRIKDDTSIGYRPLKDPDEAMEGVRSGRYYAAIIFEDGFTYDMEHFDKAIGDEKAKITYYPNIKKNAIATKITGGAAADLLEDINQEYLETVLTRFFGDTKELSDSLDTEDAVDDAIAQLTEARDALHEYNQSIALFLGSTGDITSGLSSTQRHLDSDASKGWSDIKKAKKAYRQAKKDLEAVSKEIKKEMAQIGQTIDALEEIAAALKKPIDEKERQELIEKADELIDDLLTALQKLRAMIPGEGETPASKLVAVTLDLMIDTLEKIRSDIHQPSRIDAAIQELEALKKINQEELLPALNAMVSHLKSALKLAKPLLSSAHGTLKTIDPVLESAGRTVSNLDRTLIRLQAMLVPLEEQLNEIIEKVQAADEEDRAAVLTRLLGGDPDRYASYFTKPVEVEKIKLYPTKSYGDAMAPFYTIVALWVGAVMLVTILKTSVNRRKFPQATEAQFFFGRFLLFFLIGQMQAAVTVAGNIFLLHCSPVHPWLTWLSMAITSAVFVLLIYSMILSFGNIGRAAVIVIMVLQVAGSSGSYPIELLPVIFGKIYKFFPFPYAINAMRETTCGLYGYNFLICIGQLMIFAALGLFIGLVLRKPFMGVDQYMNEKLEETEVL